MNLSFKDQLGAISGGNSKSPVKLGQLRLE